MHRRPKKRRIVFTVLILVLVVASLQFKNIIGLIYPLKYDNLIIKYSKSYNLDPYLVSAIINVESRYKPNAVSYRDAKGLMQITPTTGKWAAEKIGIKNFNENMLFEIDTNIRIGCWYLNNLKQEFSSEEPETGIVLMLAAYNGGSGNVRKWLGNKKYSQTGTALDQIPFQETREYVDKVLRNQKIYKWLYPDLQHQ